MNRTFALLHAALSAASKFVLVLSLLLLAGGCSGDGMIKVSGKVSVNGKPPQEYGPNLMVTFSLLEKDDPVDIFPATTYSDGRYEVLGRRGKGVPPGRYRIAVQVLKSSRNRNFPGPDVLKGAYGWKKSPLIHEVSRANRQIDVDVVGPSG